MKHQNQANAGADPAEVTKRGRLPFFLDRSGGAQNLTGTGVDSELASEIRFSKSSNSKEWIFFAFDRYGRYVNVKSGAVLGTGAPLQAQQDFIVISQGYLDPNDITLIRGLHQKEPLHTAFLLHRTGSFTISQDDNQVPSIN